MKIKHLTLLLLSASMLSACDKMSESNCSSEVAHKQITQNLIEVVEKEVSHAKNSGGTFVFDDTAKIRASLAQVQVVVESVLTTNKDPNSSKKFCSATLKVTVPTTMLADANQAKEYQGKPSVSQFAREIDIEDNINVFTKKDFQFNVQPTDDGKELYVETVNNTVWVGLLGNIVESALLKPILEVQKANQAQRDAQAKQELAQENAQEKQEVAQLKKEAEVSKLEAEKLEALQEKQDADRLKQELQAKQAAMATEQAATPPAPSTQIQTTDKNQTWIGDWGSDIIAVVSNKPCGNAELKSQGYDYLMAVSIPLTRLKNPADAWQISGNRAVTITGCWAKRDWNMIHAKLTRKKGDKTWEQDFKLDDGNWTAK